MKRVASFLNRLSMKRTEESVQNALQKIGLVSTFSCMRERIAKMLCACLPV